MRMISTRSRPTWAVALTTATQKVGFSPFRRVLITLTSFQLGNGPADEWAAPLKKGSTASLDTGRDNLAHLNYTPVSTCG